MSRSFGWSFMEQAGSKSISIVVQIVLARLLSPEDFGVLAILLVVVSLADSLAQSGLGLALIQKDKVSRTSYDTAFWLSLLLAAALYGIIFLCAPFVAAFYGISSIKSYLRVMGLIVLFNAMNSIQRARLQKNLDFKSLFKASILSVVVSGGVGVACALAGFGVWALVAQSSVQSICLCGTLVVVGRWRPSFSFSAKEARDLFSFGWEISLTGVLNVLYTGLSELVIGKACDTSSLGYYSQGRKYPIAAIGVINNAVANVLFPAFSAIAHDRQELYSKIRKALRLGTFVTFPIALLFISIAKPLVAILLSETWLPCVLIFQLTCFSNAFTIMQLVNLRAYMALGDSALYLRLQLVKVGIGVFAICGTAILTQNINATALATCIVGVVSVLVVDLQPAKRVLFYGRRAQLKDISRSLLVSVLALMASLVPQLVLDAWWPLLFAQTLVFIGCFYFLARVFCSFEMQETRKIIRSFLKKG